MKRFALLLALLAMPYLITVQPAPPARLRPLVFTHVAVIDVTGGQTRMGMTVVIEGGRIARLGPTGEVVIPAGAQVVNALGKFLLPGLWDMHVHSASDRVTRESLFPLYIANGVTGVRDMRGDCVSPCEGDHVPLEIVKNWRMRIAAGALLGPRIVASSPYLDGASPVWPDAVAVATEAEARPAVRHAKERGADFIKVYSRLSHHAYLAVAREARLLNIPFAGHVPESVSAAEASDVGQKSIEHLSGLLLACAMNEAALRNKYVELSARTDAWSDEARVLRHRLDEELLASYSEEKAATLFARFRRNGTWQVPTLTLLRSIAYPDEDRMLNDPRLQYMPPEERAWWASQSRSRSASKLAADLAFKKTRFQKFLEIIAGMRRAGVGILVGTDAMEAYCLPGFGVHDELALLVKAGLTPLEALQAATLNPARYLGLAGSLGAVEQDKAADLLLLESNPLADISHTKKIVAVVVGGVPHFRSQLDTILVMAEKAAVGGR